MATLILTAVGTAVGGPIGGAVGALIGQQVDQRLFAPKARQGPRLGELSVQTSSYGTAIPKIFGTMRVAGTVIWATDLREERSTSGGGKGAPKTTNYSYSASFAVALSGRPIRSVKRIWADGKLLRGAGGDFKSETGYRLYPGDEDQAPDPLIVSAEGADQTPAFRGIAYAVFEDFQLADYGNRIPSLTFEVEADAGAVAIGEVAEELSAGVMIDGGTPMLSGYAASGDSIRGAVEPLGAMAMLSVRDNGTRLTVTSQAGAPANIAADDAGVRGAGGSGGRIEVVRRSADSVAGEVSIAYYDPQRDFQTGLQRASVGGPAARSERHAIAIAMEAGAAKAIAERRLAALWTGRASARLHVGWGLSDLKPGAHLRVPGQAGLWKVERWTLDRMVVSLELVRVGSGPVPDAAEASAGRSIGHPDLVHGPTRLQLLDLPLAETTVDRPYLLVAAAGVEAGWRRAELTTSFDGGGSWTATGATAGAAVMGVASVVPVAKGAALLDMVSQVEVELLNEEMWLESRDDAALAAGANLAALGDELIQFGRAEPLGGRRFRLSRLLRGRRGTEWATGTHQVGEPFVLIDKETLRTIEVPLSAVGGEVRLMARGIGDRLEPATAARLATGEAVRPPSPVHLRAARHPNGDLEISWVRRSRNGWSWVSGSDTPLAEEREAYRLVLKGAGFERAVALAAPNYVYGAAQQAADAASGVLTVSVVQLGTVAVSRAAILAVPLS